MLAEIASKAGPDPESAVDLSTWPLPVSTWIRRVELLGRTRLYARPFPAICVVVVAF